MSCTCLSSWSRVGAGMGMGMFDDPDVVGKKGKGEGGRLD